MLCVIQLKYFIIIQKNKKKIVRYGTIALIAKLYKGKGGELLNLKKSILTFEKRS